jgi:hypothetical protein
MAKLNEEIIRQIGELRTQGKTVRDTARELGLSIGVVSKYGPEKKNSAEQPRLFQLASQVPDAEDIVERPNTVRREKLEPKRKHVRAELVSPDDRQAERQKLIDLEGLKDELRLQLEPILAKFIADCDAKNTELIDLRRQVNELREQKHEHEVNRLHEQFDTELKRLEERIVVLTAGNQPGLDPGDFMNKALDKVERQLGDFGLEASRLYHDIREDNLQLQAIALGVNLHDFNELLRENPPIEVDRQDRTELFLLELKDKEGTKLTGEELKCRSDLFERISKAQLAIEERHTKLLDYLSQQAVRPGRIPKEVQVVAAEEQTKVKAIHVSVTEIRCGGCGQVVSVDKADPVVQRSRRGKCPVCGAVMDLSGLFPGAPPQPLGPPRIFE